MPAVTQENARIAFFLILIIWLLVGRDTGLGQFVGQPPPYRRLEQQRHGLDVLNSLRWGDFSANSSAVYIPQNGTNSTDDGRGNIAGWLDIPGFRRQDGFVWGKLDMFRERCQELTRYALPVSTSIDAENKLESTPAQASLPAIWHNVTGSVYGHWTRRDAFESRSPADYDLSKLAPETEWAYTPGEWGANLTATEGRILIQLKEGDEHVYYNGTGSSTLTGDSARASSQSAHVRQMKASITLEDSGPGGSGSTSHMNLYGVHWPQHGNMLLTTTSDKFAGIFGLPHLVSSEIEFNSSQALLNKTVTRTLHGIQKSFSLSSGFPNPWSSTDASVDDWMPTLSCEYVVYLQTHPTGLHMSDPTTGEHDLMVDLEQELRFPMGKPLPRLPGLQMSAVIYSPDCAIFLESKGPPAVPSTQYDHLRGFKKEVGARQAKLSIFIWTGVISGQVLLIKAQWRDSYTPSALTRVSFWTMSMMLMADGMVFAASEVIALDAAILNLSSLILTFALLLVLFVDCAFLSEVYTAHEPEWRTLRPVSSPAGRNQPVIVPSDGDVDAEIAQTVANAASAVQTAPLLPLANPPPVRLESRATPFSTIVGRFVFLETIIALLTASSTTWRASWRSAYMNILLFVYLSLWIPQIIRNTLRNCRRAFSWRFMIGQSVLRIIPIGYFYIYENNLAFVQTDWTAFAILAGWLWLQLWVLACQDLLGPRYGLPEEWLPQAWNYHPILSEDDREAGTLPIGLMSSPASSSPASSRRSSSPHAKHGVSSTIQSVTCAICTENLDVAVIKAVGRLGQGKVADTSGIAGMMERRKYMVTPCRHMFHSPCLEGWMRFRLVCPICRDELPPL